MGPKPLRAAGRKAAVELPETARVNFLTYAAQLFSTSSPQLSTHLGQRALLYADAQQVLLSSVAARSQLCRRCGSALNRHTCSDVHISWLSKSSSKRLSKHLLAARPAASAGRPAAAQRNTVATVRVCVACHNPHVRPFISLSLAQQHLAREGFLDVPVRGATQQQQAQQRMQQQQLFRAARQQLRDGLPAAHIATRPRQLRSELLQAEGARPQEQQQQQPVPSMHQQLAQRLQQPGKRPLDVEAQAPQQPTKRPALAHEQPQQYCSAVSPAAAAAGAGITARQCEQEAAPQPPSPKLLVPAAAAAGEAAAGEAASASAPAAAVPAAASPTASAAAAAAAPTAAAGAPASSDMLETDHCGAAAEGRADDAASLHQAAAATADAPAPGAPCLVPDAAHEDLTTGALILPQQPASVAAGGPPATADELPAAEAAAEPAAEAGGPAADAADTAAGLAAEAKGQPVAAELAATTEPTSTPACEGKEAAAAAAAALMAAEVLMTIAAPCVQPANAELQRQHSGVDIAPSAAAAAGSAAPCPSGQQAQPGNGRLSDHQEQHAHQQHAAEVPVDAVMVDLAAPAAATSATSTVSGAAGYAAGFEAAGAAASNPGHQLTGSLQPAGAESLRLQRPSAMSFAAMGEPVAPVAPAPNAGLMVEGPSSLTAGMDVIAERPGIPAPAAGVVAKAMGSSLGISPVTDEGAAAAAAPYASTCDAAATVVAAAAATASSPEDVPPEDAAAGGAQQHKHTHGMEAGAAAAPAAGAAAAPAAGAAAAPAAWDVDASDECIAAGCAEPALPYAGPWAHGVRPATAATYDTDSQSGTSASGTSASGVCSEGSSEGEVPAAAAEELAGEPPGSVKELEEMQESDIDDQQEQEVAQQHKDMHLMRSTQQRSMKRPGCARSHLLHKTVGRKALRHLVYHR